MLYSRLPQCCETPILVAKLKHHLVAVAIYELSHRSSHEKLMHLFLLKILMQQPIPLVFNNVQHQSPRRPPPPPGTPRQASAKKSPQPGPMGTKHYGGPHEPSPRQFLREPCGTSSQVAGCLPCPLPGFLCACLLALSITWGYPLLSCSSPPCLFYSIAGTMKPVSRSLQMTPFSCTNQSSVA